MNRMLKHTLSLPCLQILVAVFALVFGTCALAQAQLAGASSQPHFFPAPPAGFDPVSASDADLAEYGFPRRPDPGSDSYNRWVAHMAHAKHRLDNPIATAAGAAHGQPRPQGAAGAAGQNESSNWSGLIEAYQYPYFAANGSGVQIFTTVPSVGNMNCSFGPYKTWIWAGMDGTDGMGIAPAGDYDVLQAGVAAEACTNNDPPTPPYYVWYEWFTKGCYDPNDPPCKAASVNLVVNPGDNVLVQVGYLPSSSQGLAWFLNETKETYISALFSQPASSLGGTAAYAGYTAEWILERPSVSVTDTTPYDLAATGSSTVVPEYWDTADGGIGGVWELPGVDPSGTYYLIDMTCGPGSWNPSSWCPYNYTVIASANYSIPAATMYFQVTVPVGNQ